MWCFQCHFYTIPTILWVINVFLCKKVTMQTNIHLLNFLPLCLGSMKRGNHCSWSHWQLTDVWKLPLPTWYCCRPQAKQGWNPVHSVFYELSICYLKNIKSISVTSLYKPMVGNYSTQWVSGLGMKKTVRLVNGQRGFGSQTHLLRNNLSWTLKLHWEKSAEAWIVYEQFYGLVVAFNRGLYCFLYKGVNMEAWMPL